MKPYFAAALPLQKGDRFLKNEDTKKITKRCAHNTENVKNVYSWWSRSKRRWIFVWYSPVQCTRRIAYIHHIYLWICTWIMQQTNAVFSVKLLFNSHRWDHEQAARILTKNLFKNGCSQHETEFELIQQTYHHLLLASAFNIRGSIYS